MEDTKLINWEGLLATLKRYWYRYVVVTLLLALVTGIWLEWREEQKAAVARLEADYSTVTSEQIEWLNLSSEVFSAAARPDAKYPERVSLMPLHDAIKQTLDEMTSFYSPTDAIADRARGYRDALLDVAGAINQYRPDNDGMQRLLNSLQTAANEGGELQNAVDRYRTEAWRSFLSIML